MQKLSERINRLAESATLAMARMSRELKAEGKDVIALSLGEPDFNTPEFIKDAAKKAITNNYSHYTPVPGLDGHATAESDRSYLYRGLFCELNLGGNLLVALFLHTLLFQPPLVRFPFGDAEVVFAATFKFGGIRGPVSV